MYKFDSMIMNPLAHPMSNQVTIEETPEGKFHLVFWSDRQEVRIEFNDPKAMQDKLKALASIANHAAEWGNLDSVVLEEPDHEPEYKTKY